MDLSSGDKNLVKIRQNFHVKAQKFEIPKVTVGQFHEMNNFCRIKVFFGIYLYF